jgi:23S rRNA pseudouridine2605 synthase
LNKLIARTGLASRRKADILIEQGRVAVNGVPAAVGQRINPLEDSVVVDGVALPLDPELTTWLIYKPAGVVSTMSDPQKRPTVRELVPETPVTNPVGRLDLHSEGLMLMTNDGDLALRVTHPRHGIEKTYHVLIEGALAPSQTARLTEGIELEDGIARAKRARVIDSSKGRTLVELTLTEGRNREIRRMFSAMDIDIVRLVRTSIAGITDRTLSPGACRVLTFDEIRDIYAMSEIATDDD